MIKQLVKTILSPMTHFRNLMCSLVCRIFGITQCLCNHECNCKKKKK